MTSHDAATRLAWSVWVEAMGWAIDRQLLTVDGLKAVRHELRVGKWRSDIVPESHRDQHAVMLDRVVKAIIAASPSAMRDGLATYYIAAGDLLGAS